tara:strand:- start:253 stop:1410 length:1158 start_codon:yes stop_codon:yes gene_type:complete
MYYKFGNVEIFLKTSENKNFALFYIDLDNECRFYNILNLFLEKKKNIDCICVLDNLGFNKKLSFFCSNLYHILNNTKLTIYPSSTILFPTNNITSSPNIIPVSIHSTESWNNETYICVLPGWDFYGLEWILYRWEALLATYDTNSFLPKPTYPKDLYNNLVLPSLVISTIEKFIKKYSFEKFEKNFFGLSHFYSDFGRNILELFYENSKCFLSKRQLYDKLKKIYKLTSPTHPFRSYLFYKNNCLIRSNIHFSLFICQFLSFDGMFVCSKYLQENIDNINKNIKRANIELFSILQNQKESISKQILLNFSLLNNDFNGSLCWISRKHLQNNNYIFWSYFYNNWDTINRNIFLWHSYSLKYNDTQMSIGSPLYQIYSTENIVNFMK